MSVDWGPVAAWAGAIATVGVATVSVLIAMGYFDSFKDPRLVLTFQPTEPWVRTGRDSTASARNAAAVSADEEVTWVRVAVENQGRRTAQGCVGRLDALTSHGQPRADIDPVQLRWAGVPRSQSFQPRALRPGQREYLNVLAHRPHHGWRIVTFDDPDFDPGFTLDLSSDESHRLRVAVFADNCTTAVTELATSPLAPGTAPRAAVSGQ